MEFKHTMVFDTTEELEQGFTYGNKELSIFIVDTALENLKTELTAFRKKWVQRDQKLYKTGAISKN